MKKGLLALVFVVMFFIGSINAAICDDLQALYHFEGNASDYSENGNDGTVYGATYTTSGRFGGAYSFDGTNDYIQLDNGIISSYPVVISAWLRTTATTEMRAVFSGSNLVAGDYLSIGTSTINSPGNAQLFATQNLSNIFLDGVTPISNDGWHYVVGVFASETDRRLYVDGQLDGSSSTSVLFPLTNRFTIGRRATNSPGRYWNGLIDEVAVWERELSETEILELYNSGTQITCEEPADTTPPVLSNGAPSGTLVSGTTSTTISLITDESATCRYSTTSGIAYSSMTNTFSTTGGISHSELITGLTNGNNYNYHVKCIDLSGNFNTNDYTISFSVASPVSSCSSADTNFDNVIDISELINVINEWKLGSVSISELINIINEWKSGC